jgi:putative phosphoribosyl transferase
MIFRDREAAGGALADRLLHLKQHDPVVLALPRGGVAVADPVARALDAPLGILIVRKIGAPMQPELAIGAIVDGDEPVCVFNDDILRIIGLSQSELERARRKALDEIVARRRQFAGLGTDLPCEGKAVIVVDDGIATGATVRAALKAVRSRGPAHLVLAVPVAPQDSLDSLVGDADEVVCLETPDPFYAVGAHYRAFDQLSDADVIATLRAAAARVPGAGTGRGG